MVYWRGPNLEREHPNFYCIHAKFFGRITKDAKLLIQSSKLLENTNKK